VHSGRNRKPGCLASAPVLLMLVLAATARPRAPWDVPAADGMHGHQTAAAEDAQTEEPISSQGPSLYSRYPILSVRFWKQFEVPDPASRCRIWHPIAAFGVWKR